MAGKRIGYVRVSTFGRNPERQLDIILQGLAGMPIDCDITLAA